MRRTFRSALAMASIITAIGFATIGATQAGRMDQMNRMNDFQPYTAEAFKAAQAEGRTTLLFFHAPWCPVCKAQEPKVRAHLNGDYRDIVAFKIDYDSSGALRQEFKVAKQSTLILHRGMKEIARLSYKSDDESIAQFFSQLSAAMSERR